MPDQPSTTTTVAFFRQGVSQMFFVCEMAAVPRVGDGIVLKVDEGNVLDGWVTKVVWSLDYSGITDERPYGNGMQAVEVYVK